jgi:thymidylate kinase
MHRSSGSYIPAKPYLVTIFGAAGSGKSVVAKAVADALGESFAARVPTDYFLLPRRADERLERYLERPLRWDWPLLRERLALPIGTQSTTPDVNFETFTRIAASGGRSMPIRSVMIVDAMAPFPGADLVVRLDVPDAERRDRIAARDERWGTRVRDRWAHLQLTWSSVPHHQPDMVLDGTQPIERSVTEVGQEIVERVMGTGEADDSWGLSLPRRAQRRRTTC